MMLLLIFYIFFIILFIAFSIMGLYHLYRFGYVGDWTKPAMTFYIIFSVIVITLSFVMISFQTWQ